MIERRPLLDFVSHAVLIGGALIIAFPLYVAFIASTVVWRERGLTLTQDTSFPDVSTTRLTLTLLKPQRFTLRVRHPGWVADEALRVTINGQPYDHMRVDAAPELGTAEIWEFINPMGMWHCMHAHAVNKVTSSYEHIDPAQVGNERRILVSELATSCRSSAGETVTVSWESSS